MEASALELRRETARATGLLNGPLLRLRSDEQLVELFRAGNEDAFRAIHDRYRKRLFAYAAQMLNGSGPDAEDALQDVFERAYFGLRSHDRAMALRAWLYRVAHNRCLDQLRRPALAGTAQPDEAESRALDPVAATEQRETLRRLVVDIDRLPEQQRSALLLREMSGMTYAELAGALAVSVPAVKSLLVRARIGLAAAGEARDTACSMIREELVLAQDRGVRPNANARRHLRDCPQCRHFRRSMRSVGRNLAVLTPAIGPLGFLVKLVGGGGGGLTGSGGGAAAGGTAAAGGGSFVAATGAAGSTGLVTGGFAAGGAGHVAAIVAAALVTAGGAVAARPNPASPVRVHPVINRAAPVSAPPRPAGSAGAGPTASYGVAALSGSIPAQPASSSAISRPSAVRGRETKSGHPVAAGPSKTSTPQDAGGSATGSSSAVTGSNPASGSTSTAATSSAGSTSAATSISGVTSGDSGPSSDSSAGTPSSATSAGTSASSSSTAPPSGS